jgi:hypothetical protein
MYIMQSDPNDKVRKILKEARPEAARIVLADFVGKTDRKVSNDELPDLVLEALNKIPKTGNIRRKKDKRAHKAVSWLIDEIPDSYPRREEIVKIFNEIMSRIRS